jgi:prophage regulatory protein
MLSETILRRPAVEKATGLSRSTIYRRIAEDSDFPKPVRLGPGAVGWLSSEIAAWIESRRVDREAEATTEEHGGP